MSRQLYLQILLFPLLLIVGLIGLMTLFNIQQIENHVEQIVQQRTASFVEEKKQDVASIVNQAVKLISYHHGDTEAVLKNMIKRRTDSVVSILNARYEKLKDHQSPQAIREDLLSIVASVPLKEPEDYFFITDRDNARVLHHGMPEMIGQDIRDKTNMEGIQIYTSKEEVLKTQDFGFQTLYFAKPANPDVEFPKIVYFRKFQAGPFNWIIGTGKYLDVVEQQMQKAIIDELAEINKDARDYLIISQLHNIKGGEDFATVLLTHNQAMIGQTISDDWQDAKGNYFRKDYLKLLRDEGSGYLEYWYDKPDMEVSAKKISYFYHYRPWNWILGCGFYDDDLEAEVARMRADMQKEIDQQLRNSLIAALVLFVIVGMVAFLVARNITLRIRAYSDQIEGFNHLLEEKIQEKTYDLEESRIHLETMIEHVPSSIFLVDPKTRKIVEANGIMCDNLGYTQEELTGMTINEIDAYEEPDETRRVITDIKTQHSMHFERVWKTKNGELRHHEIVATSVEFSGKERILAATHDITKRVQMENELMMLNLDLERRIQEAVDTNRQQERLLMQQSRMAAMGEMIGAIAHQWRQPLASLGGILINLQDAFEFGKLDEKTLSRKVGEGEEILDYMSRTIDDFRHFFRPSKEKTVFDVCDAVYEGLNLVYAQLKNHGIIPNYKACYPDGTYVDFTIDAKPVFDLPLYAVGFRNEFKQVVLNLINNAKDAILEQGITSGIIEIRVEADDSRIFISIVDNGGGVPEAIQERVFDPYFTTKEEGKGTGIGLYMSKMIIETNMGGVLRYQHHEDGAEFIIELEKHSG